MRFVLTVLLVGFAWQTDAAPYTERSGRLEIDWASHKIRFYGQARMPSDAQEDETFRSVEKAAWQDGLNYVNRAVRNLHVMAYENQIANPDLLSKDAAAAAKAVATSTFSRKTVYYTDGTVRVILENKLPKALTSPRLRFRQKEAAAISGRYSGVVFRLNKGLKATPLYQVVDETGALLFDEGDMAEQAYAEHLMGQWFVNPSPTELTQAIGKHPLEIKAKVDAKGRFVVDRAAWQKAVAGYRSLLVAGSIAIAMPQPQ